MLAALMRKSTFLPLFLASVCVFFLPACTGEVGTTCFQNDECDSGLICCHVGSPFVQGTCQTEMVCNDMGGGTGGVGGSGATGGSGGAAGGSGAGGSAGAAGQSGAGGQGGMAGQGGAAGAGGMGGAAGAAGMGGAAGASGAGGT